MAKQNMNLTRYEENKDYRIQVEPAHEIMVLITEGTNEGAGEPSHPHNLTRHSLFTHMKYRSRRRVAAHACLKNECTEEEKVP